MSDDEEMPPLDPEMGSEVDEDSDSAGHEDFPREELPDGVQKDLVKEADASNYKEPKKGDEVSVHYVGTLQADGSQFDSSRDRGEPFVFTLGKGQVIKGWDLGVATMRKGEIAKFTLAPEFAYGDAGSPPKIPEKATLVFEVELIGWVSKDDLFGDDGVIKTQVKEGSGWQKPQQGDEVLLSMKALGADGAVLEEKADIEYTLGSEALGPLGKACDKALMGMKKGEQITLKCTKEYMYGDERAPEGGTIELTLHDGYEKKDVSFLKDRTVIKKEVRQGEGYDTPKDACKLKLKVESVTDGDAMLPGFTPKTLEFTAGGGEVCDVLECVVLQMKKHERAVVTCTKPAMCTEPQLGIPEAPKVEKVVLTLELEDIEKGKETWDLSEEEKVEYGTARKDVGASLFKQGRMELALERYKMVIELFSYIDNFNEENKQKAEDLKQACRLNKAACHLKLEQHVDARKACDEVLKGESANVKAVFRRAQANLGLREFADCMRDTKRVLELDPQNREARALLKQARAGQKEEDDKSKGLFAKMCKGLSSPAKRAQAKSAADTPTAGESAEKADDAAAAEQAAEAETTAT